MAAREGEPEAIPASPGNVANEDQREVPAPVNLPAIIRPYKPRGNHDKLMEEKDNTIKQLRVDLRASERTIEELKHQLTQPVKVVGRVDQEIQCVYFMRDVTTQCEFSSLLHENQIEALRGELKSREQDVKDREEDLLDRSRKLIDACDENEKLRDNLRVLTEQNETLLGILKEHSTRLMKMKADLVNKEKALEKATKQVKRLKASRYQYEYSDRNFIEKTTTIAEQTEISVAPPPSLYVGPEVFQVAPNRIQLTEETKAIWEQLESTSSRLSGSTAVVRQSNAFFSKSLTGDVIGYNMEKKEWFTLPRCPHTHFTLAIVAGSVTAVGGEVSFKVTKSILSYSEDNSPTTGHWAELIPEMHVARKSPAVVTTHEYMVVGGGEVDGSAFSDIVEVLEVESNMWLMVPSLPRAGTSLSAVVCGDQLYMLGGFTQTGMSCQGYMCSMIQLKKQASTLNTLRHRKKFSDEVVWHNIADVPAYRCACVSLGGHLVVVGGCDKDYNPSNQLWYYTWSKHTWHRLPDTMPTARMDCLAVALPMDGKIRLMVVGGFASHELMSSESDAVEATTFA